MKNLLTLIAIFALATCAFGANFKAISDEVTKTAPGSSITFKPSNPDEDKNAGNAHWRAEGNEAVCLLDGGTEYSTADDTWIYAGPYDLSGYFSTDLEFYYDLTVADANDVLSVYAVTSEPTDSSGLTAPLASYNANEAGTTINLDPGDSATTYIVFRWESDDSGVAAGPVLDDALLSAVDIDGATWTSKLLWDEDHDSHGPGEDVSINLSTEAAGEVAAVSFRYVSGWDWWYEVDAVHVYDDTKADLVAEEQFESWPPTDWTIIDNDGGGDVWLSNDTTERPNYAGGSGFCAAADSDRAGGPSTTMDTELITPWFNATASTTVTVDYLASYNDNGVDDYAEVFVGVADTYTAVDDDFTDLAGWDAVDEGNYQSNIKNASLGTIKAEFK